MLDKNSIIHNSKDYIAYRESISEKYSDIWVRKYNQITFSEDELQLINQKTSPINIVAFSADWCPDCQATVPILAKISELNENITLYVINHDEHRDLLEEYKVGGRSRVPLILFMNEQFDEITRWVERSTYGYELLLNAVNEASTRNMEDHRPILRESFKLNSQELIKENKREILQLLRRSYYIINASG